MWPLNNETTSQLSNVAVDPQSKYKLLTSQPFASCVPDSVFLCWHSV